MVHGSWFMVHGLVHGVLLMGLINGLWFIVEGSGVSLP
jgi:hypothetical protein